MSSDYRVLAIVDRSLKGGFQLAGAEVIIADTPQAAQEALQKAMENGKYGIIIVEDEFLSAMEDKFRARVMESTIPLVIPVSLRKKAEESAEAYLSEMIRRAIGFQIRVRG